MSCAILREWHKITSQRKHAYKAYLPKPHFQCIMREVNVTAATLTSPKIIRTFCDLFLLFVVCEVAPSILISPVVSDLLIGKIPCEVGCVGRVAVVVPQFVSPIIYQFVSIHW